MQKNIILLAILLSCVFVVLYVLKDETQTSSTTQVSIKDSANNENKMINYSINPSQNDELKQKITKIDKLLESTEQQLAQSTIKLQTPTKRTITQNQTLKKLKKEIASTQKQIQIIKSEIK